MNLMVSTCLRSVTHPPHQAVAGSNFTCKLHEISGIQPLVSGASGFMAGGRAMAAAPPVRHKSDRMPQLLKRFAVTATPAVLVAALCLLLMRVSHSTKQPFDISVDGKMAVGQARHRLGGSNPLHAMNMIGACSAPCLREQFNRSGD